MARPVPVGELAHDPAKALGTAGLPPRPQGLRGFRGVVGPWRSGVSRCVEHGQEEAADDVAHLVVVIEVDELGSG